MTKYREILRLKSLGFSERNIANSCGVSRNTVAKVIKRAAELRISWPLDYGMTDSVLEDIMFPKTKSATNKRMPDFDYIRKELLRNGVNKKLLWVEYCEESRMNGEEPLMYSQFCYYIQKNEEKRRATMHIPRRPGEQIEVDWAGDPAHIIDPDTGEIIDAWIFVGVMTYSQYTFVEAFLDERTNNWIKAHIHMFQFFGGVTPMLVSDNCSTAINHQKSDWYTPALNTTYHEMAEHYNVAIIPARVRKPKDKPNVEGSVGKVSTWITAALRNEQFFSLSELNAAIKEKLTAYNARKFDLKECSRLSLFLGEEMPLLVALPATPFEFGEWKQATVQFNYHIAVDKMYYSVPYQYIKNKVDVRITEHTIEIFMWRKRMGAMNDILVSVIIPAYNCEKYIEKAIDSALEQTIPLEVIIINDCAKDNTEEVIRKYLSDPRVRYIRNEKNLGVAKTRNRGVRLAHGKYVAFLDSDDWWEPDKLVKQLEAMERGQVVLCSTARALVNPDGSPMGKVIPVKEKITYRELLKHNSINCSSVLVLREVMLEFPMEHEDSHEDYITWLKILKKYGSACAINEPLLKYRLSTTGKSGSKWKSARMTFKVYRYMGFGLLTSIACFCSYAVHGVWKYR